jgi:hypothetical protein
MTEYEAAKARVKRFREGESGWKIYCVHPDTSDSSTRLRADLNLIAEHEGQASECVLLDFTPTQPAITPRVYMVGQALAGLLANGSETSEATAKEAVWAAQAALKEMGE